MSARGRARADAQGRCDGVGSEEIGSSKPSHVLIGLGRASSFRIKKTKRLHFFGEAPERRPWAIKRENRPAAFAGRSKCLSDGIHAVPTQASILSRSFLPSDTRQQVNTRSRPGHIVRRSRANNVTRYTLAYCPAHEHRSSERGFCASGATITGTALPTESNTAVMQISNRSAA